MIEFVPFTVNEINTPFLNKVILLISEMDTGVEKIFLPLTATISLYC
jgi:hypothetical protein